jgi:hypothetical protein
MSDGEQSDLSTFPCPTTDPAPSAFEVETFGMRKRVLD